MGMPSFAWYHRDARAGFEVAFVTATATGLLIDGHVSAVEDGVAWAVRYAIEVDADWRTRTARVWSRSADGAAERGLEGDGAGGWRIDGAPAPHLDGCLDVDLEASALTNAFPVGRLRLAVGAAAEAPATYVRAPGLEVERLEQRYARLDGDRYDYASPAFGFTCVLAYAPDGFVRDYPGIAVRA